MSTIFDAVQTANPQRSSFDLSHDRKYTLKGGELTPIMAQEVVPGDQFNIGMQSLVRLIPMVGPTMHRVDMDIHLFYVPNRIMWRNWEKFITGSKLAGAEAGAVPVHPYLDIVQVNQEASEGQERFTTGSLADNLGYPVIDEILPATATMPYKVNALPFRAMTLIYKEYYRDQNLTALDDQWDEIYLNDGNDYAFIDEYGTYHYGVHQQRAWEKDYFTSALPFVQKGAPITIPLAGSAEVMLKAGNTNSVKMVDSIGVQAENGSPSIKQVGSISYLTNNDEDPPYLKIDPNGTLLADLTGATASTINDLRAAFQAQLWLEKNARAGTRYIESLEAHFGVRPADYRLQRPELFGATRVPVQMSEVLQTSETATSPQGNMAGHGIGFDKSNFNVFCPEHGWIIAIASIKPRTSYMYAVHKSIFRLDYLDYYWPEFARLGEQAVKRKELGFNTAITDAIITQGEQTFGYQSRYAEYRSALSTVHGGMRKDLILSRWHMSRSNVNQGSTLSSAFVYADPTTRIFADEEAEYEYIVHTHFNVRAKRSMPYFADPGLIDHQ